MLRDAKSLARTAQKMKVGAHGQTKDQFMIADNAIHNRSWKAGRDKDTMMRYRICFGTVHREKKTGQGGSA